MTKRRSGGRDDGRAAKRQRRHLYLVFDDWSCGYSIRKVDLPSGSDSDDDADPPRHAFSGEAAEPRRPRALFRVVAPRGLPHYFASAFGTRIMAMHPKVPGADGKLHVLPKDLVPVYDVRTRGVIFGLGPSLTRPTPSTSPSATGSSLWPPTPSSSSCRRRWNTPAASAGCGRGMSSRSRPSSDGTSPPTRCTPTDGPSWSAPRGAPPPPPSPSTRRRRAPSGRCPSPAARTLTPSWTPLSDCPKTRTHSATSAPATRRRPARTPATGSARPRRESSARRSCSARTRPRRTWAPPSSTWDTGVGSASCSASPSKMAALTRSRRRRRTCPGHAAMYVD